MAVHPRGSWQPILEGDLAARAHARIAQIADAIHSHRACAAGADADPSLADGDAGIALFTANAARRRGRSQTIATSVLSRAVDDIDDRWRTPGLYSGVVGTGWVMAHICNEFAGAGDLPFDELDAQLLELCGDGELELEADLIYGLVGIGVYVLERWPTPFAVDCIPLIIDRLAQARRADLGLAHGMAGVIALLGAISRLDPEWRQRIAPLIERHVDELMRHRLPPNEVICAFPSAIGGGPSRLAWCLGDASVASALLSAGIAFNRKDWCDTAQDLALAAARRPPAMSGVVDAGLCHGAAGLAHVFNRLFQATGEGRLAGAARQWFRHALEMPEHPNGIAGFAAWTYTDASGWHWRADRGFLTGAAGIGLALLAAVGAQEPAWDRVLLLSARAPAARRLQQ
jgi:lantibiotic biosynthesis protein